jgi:hypothetical protein
MGKSNKQQPPYMPWPQPHCDLTHFHTTAADGITATAFDLAFHKTAAASFGKCELT